MRAREQPDDRRVEEREGIELLPPFLPSPQLINHDRDPNKEKADAEASKRTVCGVEVSTARPSTQAGNGSTFTRTSL